MSVPSLARSDDADGPRLAVTPAMIHEAASLVAPHIVGTALIDSEPMAERLGCRVLIKAEHTQRTGSFKLRGALNAVLSLNPAQRRRGIVTASSGNHGLAVATAARIAEAACRIYLPQGASEAKVRAIGRLGAEIVIVDSADAYQAEVEATAAAGRGDGVYVSPYNDARVIAGQGTVGIDLVDDVLAMGGAGLVPDAVVVAVGGGGLISGVGTWLRDRWPSCDLIGASPANDHAMVASIQAGRVVDVDAAPTFSDGTAGGLEPGAVTLALCQRLVDRWITVDEAAIARACASMIDDHRSLVEGAAGCALAAAQIYAREHPGATIVVISCGGNVSSAALQRMLAAAG